MGQNAVLLSGDSSFVLWICCHHGGKRNAVLFFGGFKTIPDFLTFLVLVGGNVASCSPVALP